MGAKFTQIINKSPTLSRILPSALKPLNIPEEAPFQPKVSFKRSNKPNIQVLKKGVDSSRIKQEAAQELYQNGFRFIDSPISPRIVDTIAPTLTFMIQEDKKIVKPYLQSGTNLFYCGAHSHQVTELYNKLILAGLNEPVGLDPNLLADIIKVSLNGNLVHQQNICDDGFLVKLIAKDLSLAAEMALRGNYPSAICQELYKIIMMHRDMGNKDFSVVYQVLQDCRK